MEPFEIGLTLTGTVSAGAYTAGVIDFFIEALEQWELEKERNREEHKEDHDKWDTPYHDVVIKGLSGASGGGVTCGLLFNSLGKIIDPVRVPPTTATVLNNDFYNAWVDMLGIEELLKTDDLTDPAIKSIFNANAIPSIAEKILQKGLFGNTIKRNYIDPHLTALITVTNLRGIPYHVNFKGASNPILYNRHTDYAQFELSQDSVLLNNGSYLIPYDILNSEFDFGYSQLKAACLATCAFPAAFKAQPFNQDPTFYYKRNEKYTGYDGIALPLDTNYGFMCSDGGILNTEPFELLHQFMLLPKEEYNPPLPSNVKRTIIMVAPLETFKDFNKQDYDKKDDLLNVLPEDVLAIREEALFSAEEISKAYDEDIYSRFIIAPVRNAAPTSDVTCLPAITGTSLGTFGAFLSRDFREHDYFLGRRNAQLFLKNHFVIPIEKAKRNPIFESVLVNRGNFKGLIITENDIDYFPIIPLCGTAKVEAYFPIWPKDKITSSDFDKIENLTANRLEKLISVIINDLNFSWLFKPIVSCIAKRFEPKITQKVMNSIKTGLCKNDLASYKILE